MGLVLLMPLFLIIGSLWPGLVTSVRIEVKTLELKGLMMGAANITCLCDDMGGQASAITSLQLIGPDNAIIANLHHDSTLVVAKDLIMSNPKVTGAISPDIGGSYLTLALPEVYNSQSGTYACALYYYDRDGFTKEDISRQMLHAGKQDVNQVLLYMASRIASLEKETFGQGCAFSARYDHEDKLASNEVLLFRHVDTNIGGAYDPSTGIFTAPRAGLYAIHLTVLSDSGENTEVFVNIFAGDQRVGRVYAADHKNFDQTSISLAVSLLKGQTVKPVVEQILGRKVLDHVSYSSIFSGYLVQALEEPE